MNVLPYGDRALLLELDDTARVVAWTDAVRDAGLDAVGDLVPAAETLLVVLHDAARDADVAAVRQALEGLQVGEGSLPEGDAHDDQDDVVEIPVTYDGPDLDDVASLTGLSADDVVAAHTGQTWRVAFGGFAPGFGYLVGQDERLHVPRRDESRTTVPAGAVGLAGEFTGVYPRESPGGWQLIGRTDAPMWDLERDPPALLRPGATIRFVRAGS